MGAVKRSHCSRLCKRSRCKYLKLSICLIQLLISNPNVFDVCQKLNNWPCHSNTSRGDCTYPFIVKNKKPALVFKIMSSSQNMRLSLEYSFNSTCSHMRSSVGNANIVEVITSPKYHQYHQYLASPRKSSVNKKQKKNF